jgi:hypothetical protein
MTAGKDRQPLHDKSGVRMSIKMDFIRAAVASGDDGCIEWPFSRDKDGYGWCSRMGQKRAHRVAWVVANGPLPSGGHVLHKCDNPPCINPRHLWVGGHADNMRDMHEKGRASGCAVTQNLKEESHGRAKLSRQDVASIRVRRLAGESIPRLAREFGVGTQTVGDIIARRTWKTVSLREAA